MTSSHCRNERGLSLFRCLFFFHFPFSLSLSVSLPFWVYYVTLMGENRRQTQTESAWVGANMAHVCPLLYGTRFDWHSLWQSFIFNRIIVGNPIDLLCKCKHRKVTVTHKWICLANMTRQGLNSHITPVVHMNDDWSDRYTKVAGNQIEKLWTGFSS